MRLLLLLLVVVVVGLADFTGSTAAATAIVLIHYVLFRVSGPLAHALHLHVLRRQRRRRRCGALRRVRAAARGGGRRVAELLQGEVGGRLLHHLVVRLGGRRRPVAAVEGAQQGLGAADEAEYLEEDRLLNVVVSFLLYYYRGSPPNPLRIPYPSLCFNFRGS